MHHVGNMLLMGLTFIFFLQFCIMRKLVQCGKYFRSHAVPPYTSFTVHQIATRIPLGIQGHGHILYNTPVTKHPTIQRYTATTNVVILTIRVN
jgi:hypothetical protein